MKIGCHVSIVGGLDKAPQRARELGCECYQMFSRSPQGGSAPFLSDDLVENFQNANKANGFSVFYFHAPYYINFSSVDPKIRHNSGRIILEELKRAEALGARFVITHLGSARGWEVPTNAQKEVVKILVDTLKKYDGKSQLLLENSAGSGDIIGSSFYQLGEIIWAINSKKIAGICLDTQHSFASGWDWNRMDEFILQMKKIKKELRGAKICLLHINGSQTDCGSRKDRHSHLEEGKINLASFYNWVAFAEKNGIDLILETEIEGAQKDIEILKKMRNDFINTK